MYLESKHSNRLHLYVINRISGRNPPSNKKPFFFLSLFKVVGKSLALITLSFFLVFFRVFVSSTEVSSFIACNVQNCPADHDILPTGGEIHPGTRRGGSYADVCSSADAFWWAHLIQCCLIRGGYRIFPGGGQNSTPATKKICVREAREKFAGPL